MFLEHIRMISEGSFDTGVMMMLKTQLNTTGINYTLSILKYIQFIKKYPCIFTLFRIK